MGEQALETYVSDHLAGARMGCELAYRLVEMFEDDPFHPVMDRIATEIDEDRETLIAVADGLGLSRSPVKEVGAWVSEKFSAIKLGSAESQDDELGRFLALELMSLGVEGKRSLWLALERAGLAAPAGGSFDDLARRAQEQRDQLEAKRLELAASALAGGSAVAQ